MYYLIKPTDKDFQHHGILGMKWGIRRYEEKDRRLRALEEKRDRR